MEEIVISMDNAYSSRNDSFIDKLIDFLKGVDVTKQKLTVASNKKREWRSLVRLIPFKGVYDMSYRILKLKCRQALMNGELYISTT